MMLAVPADLGQRILDLARIAAAMHAAHEAGEPLPTPARSAERLDGLREAPAEVEARAQELATARGREAHR